MEEIAKDGDTKEVEEQEEEVVEVGRLPWFYTRPPGYYQLNARSKEVNH